MPAAAGEKEKKKRVYYIHGIGDHAGFYGYFAKYFSEAGFEVLAFDKMAFGKSEGKPRGIINHPDEILEQHE